MPTTDEAPADAANGPLSDPLEEARRIVGVAEGEGIALRATGGVAIALVCPSALRPPLARTYQDIDFVVSSKQSHSIKDVFVGLGYEPAEEFNVLHGQHRLFFEDHRHKRLADVFLDQIEMCHKLDLRGRTSSPGPTLTAADLLLSKLQVVETNEKDYKDAIALLADHELTADESGISLERLNGICANDWGWWRTVTMVAERTHKVAREMSRDAASGLDHVPDRIRQLIGELEQAPKSRKWKMRARVGDRVRWHDEPEDIEH